MESRPGVVVVTGGSRGIGAATAVAVAGMGHAVAVNFRHDAEAADAVVARIRDAGGRALAIQADVSREARSNACSRPAPTVLARWSVS